MNNDLNPNTEAIATESLNFALQINNIDHLRVLLSAAICITDERPNLNAKDYLEAIKQVAEKNGMLK